MGRFVGRVAIRDICHEWQLRGERRGGFMLLVFADREELIRAVGPGRIKKMVELGVYEGEFAEFCNATLVPDEYTLIDFWKFEQYSFVLPDSPQMRELPAIYRTYFKGDPAVALEAAFATVKSRFASHPNVRVVRADVADAARETPDGSLDLIYLDANHTYEFVLRDLMLWFPKLRTGGLFVCNDFCEGRIAAGQNIGVIPAFNTFSKRTRTFPIALSALDWSDFYFSNVPTSPLIEHLTSTILGSSAPPVVELPDELLANFHHRVIYANGAAVRLLPVFRSLAATD
jgi:methyltransferase family protein